MRISDWSSDVCSSDLKRGVGHVHRAIRRVARLGLAQSWRHTRHCPGRHQRIPARPVSPLIHFIQAVPSALQGALPSSTRSYPMKHSVVLSLPTLATTLLLSLADNAPDPQDVNQLIGDGPGAPVRPE